MAEICITCTRWALFKQALDNIFYERIDTVKQGPKRPAVASMY